MKIVCDNCATKYSIADEKVRGKVFKIRCKKCSHVIVVKGGEDGAVAAGDAAAGDLGYDGEESTAIAPSAAPASTPDAGGAGDSVWHLVIDREQVGPMTPAEVRAKFAAGQCDAETYSWREGFGDWLRLGSIDEFRDLNTPAAAPAKAANDMSTMMAGELPPEVAALMAQRNGGAAPVSDSAQTGRTDAADVFASHQASLPPEDDGAGDLFGNAAATQMAAPGFSDDPFAQQHAAPAHEPEPEHAASSGMDFSAAAASLAQSSNAQPSNGSSGGGGLGESFGDSFPDAVGGPKLIGERNENSALFSLSNLQSLASPGKASSMGPSAPLPGTASSKPGYANSATEGSGLIDIRAMAQQTMSAGPGPSSHDSMSGPSEMPNLGAPPVFSPVVAAPILMPSQQSGMPKWVWGVIAGGGVFVLAIVGLLVALVMKKEPQQPQYAIAPPPAAVAPAPAAPVAPVAAVAAAPVAAAPAPAAEDDKKSGHHSDHHSSSHSSSGDKAAKGDAPSAPAPVAAAPERKKPAKDSLDDLLDNAAPTPNSSKKRAAQSDDGGGDSSLPDQLSRDQIKAGMTSVSGKAVGCFQQFHVPGTALAKVNIAGSGRISSCDIMGVLSGTPTGDCVCKAVKSGSFGRFKGPAMSVTYPFMLR